MVQSIQKKRGEPRGAQGNKESEKSNEDIKELEKWMHHSSVRLKASRSAFVVAVEFSTFGTPQKQLPTPTTPMT